MKVTEITYERVVSVPGKYESKRLSMKANVDEEEDERRVFEVLKDEVNELLGVKE